MKKIIAVFMCFLTINSFSQKDETTDISSYIDKNISLEKFKVLGISPTTYARCLESKNYLEPDKKLNYISINGIDFSDNGDKNDLIANDGILTSTTVFKYKEGSTPLTSGQYAEVSANTRITDYQFNKEPLNQEKEQGKFKIGFDCDIYTVGCTSPEATCAACHYNVWPRSCVVIKNCHFTLEWEW